MEELKLGDEMENEILLDNIHNGDTESLEYLINKYKNFVRMKASKYFLIGGDREDIFQEGMIGLFKAIRDYKKEKKISFLSFAELCINRQMITAIKTATRQKHTPLNSYISINKPMYEDDDSSSLLEILHIYGDNDPVLTMINKESNNELNEKINQVLSELEKKVLELYLEGQSYVEISEILNAQVKSIDNALQRVKRKLEKNILVTQS